MLDLGLIMEWMCLKEGCENGRVILAKYTDKYDEKKGSYCYYHTLCSNCGKYNGWSEKFCYSCEEKKS